MKTMDVGLLAIGAGLAIGLAALATGYAQARIGAAGIGALAEKPELTGRVILLLAFGSVIAVNRPLDEATAEAGSLYPVPRYMSEAELTTIVNGLRAA